VYTLSLQLNAFLTEVYITLATISKQSLIACASHGTCPQHVTETNRQTESMNCTVEDMLRHFVFPTMTYWDQLLVHAQFSTNNAWQKSMQNTPCYLNHGCHPRTPLSVSFARASSKILLLLLLHSTCDTQLHAPKHACSMHSTGKSTRYNKKHVPFVFYIGADVLLATTDLHLRTTVTCKRIPRCVGHSKSWLAWVALLIVWIFQTACIKFTMFSMSLSSNLSHHVMQK